MYLYRKKNDLSNSVNSMQIFSQQISQQKFGYYEIVRKVVVFKDIMVPRRITLLSQRDHKGSESFPLFFIKTL